MPLDITDDAVYTALTGFLQLCIPQGTPIQRGQQNRVPMPNVPCVIMTTIGAPRRIGTNQETTEAIVVDGELQSFEAEVQADFEYSIQTDFYSPDAESWATAAELLWRGKIGWAFMPKGMKPLYSEGRQQLPIVAAENQWINRWTMTLVLDYQPTFSLPTQAATVATVKAEAIDVYFPTGFTADSDIPADSDITT